MYQPTLGSFSSRDPLPRLQGEDLLFDNINLYAYVKNWPTNLTDPTGLEPWLFPWESGASWNPIDTASLWFGHTPSEHLDGLYTGDTNPAPNVRNAAHTAAGNVVLCWYDCEVQIHESACAALDVAAISGGVYSLKFTHLEVAKTATEISRRLGPKAAISKTTTILSRIASKLDGTKWQKTANSLRTYVQQISKSPKSTAASQVVAGLAIVELGFSIYCGYNCSGSGVIKPINNPLPVNPAPIAVPEIPVIPIPKGGRHGVIQVF